MPQKPWMFSLKDAQANLPENTSSFRFHYLVRHGTMKAGLYAPRLVDFQGPHKQDEIYIIVSGTGAIVKNGERHPFAPQDVILIEAGARHYFEDFTEDFATWVLFWGPDGGDA